MRIFACAAAATRLARARRACPAIGWPTRSSTNICCTWPIATPPCCCRAILNWKPRVAGQSGCCCGCSSGQRPCARWPPGRAVTDDLFVQQSEVITPAIFRNRFSEDPAGARFLEILAEEALLPVVRHGLVMHGFRGELRRSSRLGRRGVTVPGPRRGDRDSAAGQGKSCLQDPPPRGDFVISSRHWQHPPDKSPRNLRDRFER